MKVLCKHCGNVVGEYALIKDQIWIMVGPSLLLRSAHGICICGKEWHWCASKRSLDLLSNRDNPNVVESFQIVSYNMAVEG